MPKDFRVRRKNRTPFSYRTFRKPLIELLKSVPALKARGNRQLQLTFEDQLDALILFHLEEHDSGRELLQALNQDDFARNEIAHGKEIKHSTFFESVNSRGLEQMLHIFNGLYARARQVLPDNHAALGDLVAIDGSLIDAVHSMDWADYILSSNKAKIHLALDLNRGIPRRIEISGGKSYEGDYLNALIEKGQTGVLDRGYQKYENFDRLQAMGKHFVCRIQARTTKEIVSSNPIAPDGNIFYDSLCLLGQPGFNQTEIPVRVVGYRVEEKDCWVATDRGDLSAEQIAEIYGLRWNIETFFGWWKQHLNVYPLIARTEYGFTIQILAGLITYLLLAIYCHEQHGEKVSIKRVRELRHNIRNENTMAAFSNPQTLKNRNRKAKQKRRNKKLTHAKT